MTYRRVAVKLKGLPAPSEHQEQVTLMQWAATQYVSHPELRWLFAVPNEGGKGLGAVIRGAKMKREGLQSGYPDIGLDVARGPYHGLRIELKRCRAGKQSGGRLSEQQRAWAAWLIQQGYAWYVACGWQKAAEQLLAYLALPRYGSVPRQSDLAGYGFGGAFNIGNAG